MITKYYIKQCEQAEEIQKEWKPKIGDEFFNKYKYDNSPSYISELRGIYGEEYYKNNYTWLLTLEQLFGIAFKADEKNRVQLYYGINECDEGKYQLQIDQIQPQDLNYEEEYISDSIQGCLLQHIYKIKYNKIWTGEIWK